MALPWSVLSLGQAPTSTVQGDFVGSPLVASDFDGGDDAAGSRAGSGAGASASAGSCLGASAGAGRGGTFRLRMVCWAAAGGGAAGDARSRRAKLGTPPSPRIQKTPAPPRSARTTAQATTVMANLRVPSRPPEAVAMRLL